MSSKVTTLAQMKAAAARGIQADGEIAAAAAEAIEEVAQIAAAAAAYAVCDTAAATAAKTVTWDGTFTLNTGASIKVKFTYANTAASPTLNVNETGDIAIVKYGTTAASTYMWRVGAVVEFTYDGTSWVMENGTLATTSYYGVTKLSTSVSSTSTSVAATPSAVKTAYDLANTASETAETKADKPTPVSITIPTDGWVYEETDSDGSANDFPYYYDITVSGVTAYDRASITLAANSIAAATSCGLCPTNETSADTIRIRAVTVPETAITAEYWIESGKES